MACQIYSLFEEELDQIKQKNSYRTLKTIQGKNGKFVTYKDRRQLNLSSNDYLGLATDKELHNDFYSRLDHMNTVDLFGLGSSSSRLLTGDYTLYSELEKRIAALYNGLILSDNNSCTDRKEALVFNSGYHANVGIISSLVGRGDLILSDRLNHASIIDGLRLSGADFFPFEHLNYEELSDILDEKRENYSKALIVSESVFSMDGDIADLKKLITIKNNFNALLYIDEAHALGVFGEKGLGLCERERVVSDIDIIIATFGKSLASLGAFCVTNLLLKEYLINKMRTLIFTTALPPVVVNWNLYIMEKIPSFKEKRKRLLELADRLRESLAGTGLETRGKSQIIPVIIGDNDRTVIKANDLQDQGFLLFPIRPPSVPQKSSRIRISLTANIEWEDVEIIADIMSKSSLP